MNQSILLSAYQCAPAAGSVSRIGWEWATRLSRRMKLTLLTHVRNREAIEEQREALHEAEVIYLDTEWFASPLHNFARRLFHHSEHAIFMISSLDYLLFDRLSTDVLRQRLRNGQSWQIIHAVTPVSPLTPTTLPNLGLPTVVGPLNGGLGLPPGFRSILRQESSGLYHLRRLPGWIQHCYGSLGRASLILTATRATRESLSRIPAEKLVSMPENGVDLDLFEAAPWPAPPGPNNPLRLLFAGRLVPVKGLPMLLDAVASVANRIPISLTIAGNGPMRDEWEAAATRLGIGSLVRFTGHLDHDLLAREMRDCHLFCLPSVRESGGAVLLEAMACARPVVAIAYGGPGELVDDRVGHAIPPVNPETVTRHLANTFIDATRHPRRWRARGLAGRSRVERYFTWNAKVEQALSLYQMIIDRQSQPRDPECPSVIPVD